MRADYCKREKEIEKKSRRWQEMEKDWAKSVWKETEQKKSEYKKDRKKVVVLGREKCL